LQSKLEMLVRNQLRESIAVMQSVVDNESISDSLVRAAEHTAKAMKEGCKLMVAGNGGSAADSQHLVAEFVSRLNVDRPALRAIALTVDTSILTAIGNDFSYDNVFERQIEALGQRGDVFLGVSTSGNSRNVIKALKLCKALGIATIGFTGAGGGAMQEFCHYSVIVPSNTTMNIQESHLALEHIFCMLVERWYFGPDFESKCKILSE
jgi:D-sedoheptulose 7-phosphate isomerase